MNAFTRSCSWVRIALATALWSLAPLVPVQALEGQEAPSPEQEAPEREPGSELAVSLVTFGPGDIFWEAFGHNALWIENRDTGQGVLYHWGLFDFTEPGFVPRFLRGEMIYSMGASDPARTFQAYQRVNRSITVQELNLAPVQRITLYRLVQENLQDPRYRYDIFLDNCSTRVRDMLDRVTGGALRRHAANLPGEDYWFHVARLTQDRPVVLTGMEILLGNGGSRPISRWDAMFTPLVLDDVVREMKLDMGFDSVAFVAEERELYVATRESEPASPTPYVWIVGLVGVLAAVLTGLAAKAAGTGSKLGRFGFAVLGGGWSLFAGLLGVILLSGFLTDHHWMFWNENLFQFTPLSLALAVLLPLAAFRGERGRWVGRVALMVLSLSLVGWMLQVVPGVDQRNGELLSLTVPLHLVLVWGLTRIPLAGGAILPGGFRAPEAR